VIATRWFGVPYALVQYNHGKMGIAILTLVYSQVTAGGMGCGWRGSRAGGTGGGGGGVPAGAPRVFNPLAQPSQAFKMIKMAAALAN
jgi:hypothetical protein